MSIVLRFYVNFLRFYNHSFATLCSNLSRDVQNFATYCPDFCHFLPDVQSFETLCSDVLTFRTFCPDFDDFIPRLLRLYAQNFATFFKKSRLSGSCPLDFCVLMPKISSLYSRCQDFQDFVPRLSQVYFDDFIPRFLRLDAQNFATFFHMSRLSGLFPLDFCEFMCRLLRLHAQIFVTFSRFPDFRDLTPKLHDIFDFDSVFIYLYFNFHIFQFSFIYTYFHHLVSTFSRPIFGSFTIWRPNFRPPRLSVHTLANSIGIGLSNLGFELSCGPRLEFNFSDIVSYTCFRCEILLHGVKKGIKTIPFCWASGRGGGFKKT